MDRVKNLVKEIPILNRLASKVHKKLKVVQFSGSEEYWIRRYQNKVGSGRGSYGGLSDFKSGVINRFVRDHDVTSVIEYGCGDGNQLRSATYRSYVGFDVSPATLSQCKGAFSRDRTKRFELMSDYKEEVADLTLSLDVVYHLVEDDVFERYMSRLFGSSTCFVIVYSSNQNEQVETGAPYIRHRKFTEWVEENISGWRLMERIPNENPYTGDFEQGSYADFYVYQKA